MQEILKAQTSDRKYKLFMYDHEEETRIIGKLEPQQRDANGKKVKPITSRHDYAPVNRYEVVYKELDSLIEASGEDKDFYTSIDVSGEMFNRFEFRFLETPCYGNLTIRDKVTGETRQVSRDYVYETIDSLREFVDGHLTEEA